MICDRRYCELMAGYNRWMNEKLYGICALIPDRKRKEDSGAFFKSIHGTLNHLLYGDRAWMSRFTGKHVSLTNLDRELYSDFDELQKEREITDLEIVEWSQTISAKWLERPFEYVSNVDGKTRILPTWVLVTHMFNHQTHHRGQLTVLLTQLGYDPGVTDIPWLPSLNQINT